MILRELRERKRISQQALGELFEVSAQTINNWECGKAEPDFEALMGLALFFGVSVDTLIGFDVKGNASTLRSCPFCGGRARIITGVSTSGSLKPSAHIKCEDCLAETAWAEDVNSDGTFIDEAKRRWNMRIHKIGEKLFPTYTGGNVLEKPERLKKVLKTDNIPTDEEFTNAVEDILTYYFNEKTYSGAVNADTDPIQGTVYFNRFSRKSIHLPFKIHHRARDKLP